MPAKKRQSSLSKTKSTTTYAHGGPMQHFREMHEARKAELSKRVLLKAQTGLPEMGMHTYGAPHLPSKKMERTYKQAGRQIERDKAKEHRQMGRAEKLFNKGWHLKDKANLSKPGKAPSGYVNEKKAARINKRASKAINKSIKIQDKYLWD